MEGRVRELALFNLGIDSKLRGCELVALKVRDVCHGDQLATRAIVMQHQTQFEITQGSWDAVQAWIRREALKPEVFLFPSRIHDSPHLGTRQYARILGHWVDDLGLDRADYGGPGQASPPRARVWSVTSACRTPGSPSRHRGLEHAFNRPAGDDRMPHRTQVVFELTPNAFPTQLMHEIGQRLLADCFGPEQLQ